MLLLKQIGKIIYLKSHPELIFERIMAKGIPAYLDAQNPRQSFEKLAAERELTYRAAADFTYDASKCSAEEAAHIIVHILGLTSIG